MQVDDAGVVVSAVRRLIEALAIHRQRRRAAAEPAGRLDNVGSFDAADFGNDGRRIIFGDLGERREAIGMGSDVGCIDEVFGDQHVEHAIEQCDVCARLDRQMQVGNLGTFRAARVGDDDLQVRIGGPRVLDIAEDDGMRHRRVGAGDEDDLGLKDVRVAARRRVGAERLFVAGDGRRHAQPRIGIDVVGADQPLGQLVEDIVVLGHQLAGNVEGHRIRAVGANGVGEAFGGFVERLVPVEPLTTAAHDAAPFRVLQTIGEFSSLSESRTLGAQAPAVGGVVRVTASVGDRSVLGFYDNAATDAAVTTGGFDLSVHEVPSGQPLSNRRAM